MAFAPPISALLGYDASAAARNRRPDSRSCRLHPKETHTPSWLVEPGHTSAEFCARLRMVTWVRGPFKHIDGKLRFDPTNLADSAVDVEINAASLWSGDEAQDGHLRNEDFLDVDSHSTITFTGDDVSVLTRTISALPATSPCAASRRGPF